VRAPERLPWLGGLNRRKCSNDHDSWVFSNVDGQSCGPVCDLSEDEQACVKEGPKFIHRLVAKQKSRAKE
jgi:hypothetical protein